ncbi:ANTAR domain-containing protein [Streptomyces sp. NPDC049915]|uniref:ANTAR domain-containing protein n=1 Tax=Streptomyces sp. NPDC049915 TaxID=3155510 RepID=UPI0034133EE4
MVVEVRVSGGRAELRPRGELVHGCARTLADTLGELPDGVREIELDMSGVHFMDTAGLGFLDLLDDHRHRHGVPVRTAHWQGQPRRILELAGLDTEEPLRSAAHGGAGPAGPPPRTTSAVALERAERLRMLREEIAQLRQAIASRPVIDQARGMLMAAHGCTSQEAWTILRETSQLSNTKLRTVAAMVTAGAGSEGTPLPDDIRSALRTALFHHRS